MLQWQLEWGWPRPGGRHLHKDACPLVPPPPYDSGIILDPTNSSLIAYANDGKPDLSLCMQRVGNNRLCVLRRTQHEHGEVHRRKCPYIIVRKVNGPFTKPCVPYASVRLTPNRTFT